MRVNSFSTLSMQRPKPSVTEAQDAGFAESMAGAADKAAMDALVSKLEQKHGIKITIGDSSSVGEKTGHGNVTIAPNILKEMQSNPAKMAEYEKMIQDHKDWLAFVNEESGKEGKMAVSSGLEILSDGRMSQWVVAEDSPDAAKLNMMKPDSQDEDEWWMNIKENVDRERELRNLLMKNLDETTPKTTA